MATFKALTVNVNGIVTEISSTDILYSGGGLDITGGLIYSSAVKAAILGTSNTALGVNALLTNTTGTDNSALGVSALRLNTTGAGNSALGAGSLYTNTTGVNNSAVGVNALNANTIGASNSAVGVGALLNNTSGNNNTALGVNALLTNTTGTGNSALGVSALRLNTTGVDNSALAANALYNNTTGISNVAMGISALFDNTTGSSNSALGVNAGYNSGVLLQTNAESVFIGYGANTSVDGLNNVIVIGKDAQATKSNLVVLGHSTVTETWLRGSIGIGTTSPNASAIVDVTSTTKGALFPRMTTANRDAIASPVQGLLVYNTSVNRFDFSNGVSWQGIVVGSMFTDTVSIDFTYDATASTVSAVVLPAGVNHDLLLNYSANKHIDHTAVTIGTTSPLSGGGDISANRTFSVGGLSTLGTANYIVGANLGATAWEYKQILGVADEIDITHAANSITIGLVNPLIVTKGGTGLSATTINQLLYSSAANTIAGLATANNGVLITSGAGVPSVSSTIPTATQDNITRLGTIVSGVWNGTALTAGYVPNLESLNGTLDVTNGGTGTATQFTQGSVVFAGVNGVYTEDNANLFWNNTTNKLGIGTAAPAQALHVMGGTILVTNGFTPDSTSGIKIEATISASQYNWLIGGQYNLGGFEITPSTLTGGTTFSTPAIAILPSGKVGINENVPLTLLHVTGTDDTTVVTVKISSTQANVTATDIFMDFRSTTGSEATIAGTAVAGVIAYNTFTGSHYTEVIGDTTELEPGTVLEIVGGTVSFKDSAPKPQLFKTRVCESKQNPAAVGVYGGTDREGKALVLSIGTGLVLVANKGADLGIGDYLMSSDVRGCAELQASEVYCNYTLAKVTEAVSWKQGEKKRLVKCIYLGG